MLKLLISLFWFLKKIINVERVSTTGHVDVPACIIYRQQQDANEHIRNPLREDNDFKATYWHEASEDDECASMDADLGIWDQIANAEGQPFLDYTITLLDGALCQFLEIRYGTVLYRVRRPNTGTWDMTNQWADV